jgi:hypothetical protein
VGEDCNGAALSVTSPTWTGLGLYLSSPYCKAGDQPRDPWYNRPLPTVTYFSLNVAFVIISLSTVKFHVSTALEIHVVVCRVMRPCILVGG